jgi:hypothetical protein
MPKDDAIGAPQEIPANRLLLGLRTGLRSGAIGALRTQMTGVAGPLGLHARREGAVEPVSVPKERCRRCLCKTPAKRQLLGLHWGTDRVQSVPAIPNGRRAAPWDSYASTRKRARLGRRGADGAQRVARSVPATKLLLVGGFQGFGGGLRQRGGAACLRSRKGRYSMQTCSCNRCRAIGADRCPIIRTSTSAGRSCSTILTRATRRRSLPTSATSGGATRRFEFEASRP